MADRIPPAQSGSLTEMIMQLIKNLWFLKLRQPLDLLWTMYPLFFIWLNKIVSYFHFQLLFLMIRIKWVFEVIWGLLRYNISLLRKQEEGLMLWLFYHIALSRRHLLECLLKRCWMRGFFMSISKNYGSSII